MGNAMIDRLTQDHAAACARETAACVDALSRTVLGRIGSLTVRLARDAGEIEAAQEIRFRVFHEELGAKALAAGLHDRRDADRFDDVCDHLLVLDDSIAGPEHQRIVGTYRLLRQECAIESRGVPLRGQFARRTPAARPPRLLSRGLPPARLPRKNLLAKKTRYPSDVEEIQTPPAPGFCPAHPARAFVTVSGKRVYQRPYFSPPQAPLWLTGNGYRWV